MSILLVLIPITLLLVIAGGFAFFWAVNHDQFDDMDTPALLPLVDGDPVDDRTSDRAGGRAGGRTGGRTGGRADGRPGPAAESRFGGPSP